MSLKRAGFPILNRCLVIISIEALNFALILMFKYGCLKENFSKVVKKKFDIEFGDGTKTNK